MDTLFQDLRFGWRQLRRTPGFTLAAVLALALGVGATTAIFSVVNAVVLRPIPIADPDRVVRIYETNPKNDYVRGFAIQTVGPLPIAFAKQMMVAKGCLGLGPATGDDGLQPLGGAGRAGRNPTLGR